MATYNRIGARAVKQAAQARSKMQGIKPEGLTPYAAFAHVKKMPELLDYCLEHQHNQKPARIALEKAIDLMIAGALPDGEYDRVDDE